MLITKWTLKMWIIISKRHFAIFLDNCTFKSKATKKQIVRLQLNENKSQGSQTRLMRWYWKRKSTWRKDLITYNSHPWIVLSFNWLVIIWKGGEGTRGVGGPENCKIFMDVIYVSSLIKMLIRIDYLWHSAFVVCVWLNLFFPEHLNFFFFFMILKYFWKKL